MEHIRQVYRQSPFVLVHPLGISALILLLPGYAIFRYGSGIGSLRTIFFILCIAVILYSLRTILIWRLNRYVVTNQRLLHYSQKGLFDQTVTETPHERVLNVSYTSQGIISMIVGYGNVVIQVVGLMEPIIFKNIASPMAIKDYLWEMHKRLAQDKSNTVYGEADATHLQEQVGYTKNNTF